MNAKNKQNYKKILTYGADIDIVLNQMDDHSQKAIKSLAGYKFWMFGYHAACWVNLNKLLPGKLKRKNPFRIFVDVARDPGLNGQE